MDSSLKKLKLIIEDLENRAKHADEINASRQSKNRKPTAIIESSEFSGQSNRLTYYINQVKTNFTYLTHFQALGDNSKVNILINTIDNQILAITNALKAQPTIKKNAKSSKQMLSALKAGAARKSTTFELYEKLSEYKGYETRLDNMLTDHLKNIRDKQQNEVTDAKAMALYQRLSNCRKAIIAVEIEIQRVESQKRY